MQKTIKQQNEIKDYHKKIIESNYKMMIEIKSVLRTARIDENINFDTFNALLEVEKQIRLKLVNTLKNYPLQVSAKVFERFNKIV